MLYYNNDNKYQNKFDPDNPDGIHNVSDVVKGKIVETKYDPTNYESGSIIIRGGLFLKKISLFHFLTLLDLNTSRNSGHKNKKTLQDIRETEKNKVQSKQRQISTKLTLQNNLPRALLCA